MTDRKVVITHARRTPIGKFLGAYRDVPGRDLGVAVVRALLEESGLPPERVGLGVLGNARQAGAGPNLARQVTVGSGIPVETPAYTVNQACASGLLAITLAADAVRQGRADAAVAGGLENMSRLPYLIEGVRTGTKLGHLDLVDANYRDGFFDPLSEMLMGCTAENLVEKYDISREEQDAYAAESQARCGRAQGDGRFEAEIVPVPVPERRRETALVRIDEHPRKGVTAESLARLPPVFKEGGTVHAGNSSGVTDGAAAVLLMAEETAAERGLTPLATVGEHATVGVDPAIMGIGPVGAVRDLERRTSVAVDGYDLIELNEAFAAQVLACDRELGLPRDRLNVNGGAIALGHPIGCSGARIVVTLLHEMARREADRGLATLCVSGGLGVAAEFQRWKP